MMRVTWSLVVLLSFTGRVAHGFSSGAPPARCDNMIPAHRNGPEQIMPQTSPLPYNFQMSKFTYVPNEKITMRLARGRASSFNGFLIKVVTDEGEAVGVMTAPRGYKTLTCGINGNEALTHTEGSQKPGVQFIFTTPPVSKGALTVRATIVYDYSTFWVNEVIATLQPASGVLSQLSTTVSPPLTTAPVLTTTPPDTTKSAKLTTHFKAPELPVVTTATTETSISTTTEPPVKVVPEVRSIPAVVSKAGVIEYDPACGSSKGCFVDCNSDGCKFMVTWEDVGFGVRFELYGKPKHPESWIAIGFSKDTRMGEDSVVECIHSGGIVQAFNSYNPSIYNKRLVQHATTGIAGVSGSYYNGVFKCQFIRAYRVQTEPRIFDLQQDWNIMFAHGGLAPGSVGMNKHTEMPVVSASRIDYQSFDVVGKAATFTLVKVHGCLMILAWVLFCGVGVCVARYYKNVWADKTFLKLKIWFQVHRSCMVTALILDIIAFIIIFVDVKGYSQIPDIPGKSYLKSHPILGIIVTLLCVANPIMALFRPGPTDSKRPIFNWAHWGVGISAYILSALTICFGFELGKASTPDYAVYIMIGYIVYIVLFDIACEVHDYITKKEKKAKSDSVEMNTHNGTENGVANGDTNKYTTKEKTRRSDKLKTILLAVHIALTGAFALVLVLVVALN